MSKARELADLINKLDGGAGGPVREQWARTVGAFDLVNKTITETLERLEAVNERLKYQQSMLRHFRQSEQERTKLYVARAEAIARMRKDILTELEAIIPFSVFPSGIIDDPDAPPLDEAAAEDFIATLKEGLSWEEISDLVLLQDQLKKCTAEAENIKREEQAEEGKSANDIQELITKIRDSKVEIEQLEQELSSVQEFREIIERRAAPDLMLDGKPVEMKAKAKIGIEASGKIRVVQDAITINVQKVKQLEKSLAISEGRNRQLTSELDEKESELKRQKENAQRAILLPASAYKQLRLNMLQFTKEDRALRGRPIDRWIAELAERNIVGYPQEALLITAQKHRDWVRDHARRQLALRAGVHLRQRTIMIRPTMLDQRNIYKCELLDAEGREAYLALGIVDRSTEGATKGEWGKLYVASCMSAHPSWTEKYERSGIVPNDITSNYRYSIDPDILQAYETLSQNLPVEPTDMLGLTTHNVAHSIIFN
jgi:hypothetical protein